MASSSSKQLEATFVFDYFSQLNSIANKIQSEINETISNYEHLWDDLKDAEKFTVINETIMKPEIMLNYISEGTKASKTGNSIDFLDSECSLLQYFVKRKAAKGDDEHGMAPFSYKTRSQLNLAIDQPVGSLIQSSAAVKQDGSQKEKLQQGINFVNLNLNKSVPEPKQKPTVPPPPPPVTAVTTMMPQTKETVPLVAPKAAMAEAEEDEEEEEIIMQPDISETKALLTTYDFLNNW